MKYEIDTNPKKSSAFIFSGSMSGRIVLSIETDRLHRLTKELYRRSLMVESTGTLVEDRLVLIPINNTHYTGCEIISIDAIEGDVVDVRRVTCGLSYDPETTGHIVVDNSDYHVIAHTRKGNTRMILIESLYREQGEDFYSIFAAPDALRVYIETESAGKEIIFV